MHLYEHHLISCFAIPLHTKGLQSLYRKRKKFLVLTFFRVPEKKKKRIFLFFTVGRPVQNHQQNPAPGGCLFSTRKSGSEVPERGDFWEENCPGKGGVDRAKKGKKDAQKKVGVSFEANYFLILGL